MVSTIIKTLLFYKYSVYIYLGAFKVSRLFSTDSETDEQGCSMSDSETNEQGCSMSA